jgi:potassium voltage-gated channel Eag-related subfamily H protein 7
MHSKHDRPAPPSQAVGGHLSVSPKGKGNATVFPGDSTGDRATDKRGSTAICAERAADVQDQVNQRQALKKKYDDLKFANAGTKSFTEELVDTRQKHKERQKAQTVSSDKMVITYASEDGCMNRFILHPHSPTTKQWDIYIAVLLIYTAYVTPYEVAFLTTKFDPMFVINQVVNLSFLLDMVKTFFTAYLDKENAVLTGDVWRITKAYFSSWFVVDLVSILPFDSVGLITQSETLQKAKGARIIRLLRLLKLLRLLRSMRIFTRYQDTIALTYASKSLLRFTVLIVTAMHWMACGIRLLPDLVETINPEFNEAGGRYLKYHEAGGEVTHAEGTWDSTGNPEFVSWLTFTSSANTPVSDLGPSQEYTWALYWSAMTLTTIGYGDIAAKTLAEAVWMTFGMIIGSAIYAYAIGEVCGIVANMDAATTEYNQQSDLLNYFCAENGMPQSLRVRLRQYFRQGRQMQRDRYFKGLLDHMSPTLRSEVTIFLNADQLLGIPFFNIGVSNEHEYHRFLAQITMRMETCLFAAEEIVISFGDRMRGVYLVSKGLAFGGRQEPICKWGVFPVGKWFGTEGLLLQRRHMYEMRALKLLQTEFVAKSSLDEVLDEGDFDMIHRSVRQAVMKHVFLLSITRFVERLAKLQDQSHAAGQEEVTVLHFHPTPHEEAYIRDGVYADLSMADEEREKVDMEKLAEKKSVPTVLTRMESMQSLRHDSLQETMVAQNEMLEAMAEQVSALTNSMTAMQMEMGSMRAAISRTVPSRPGSARKVPSMEAVHAGKGPPSDLFRREPLR